jgi:hypothetical protein
MHVRGLGRVHAGNNVVANHAPGCTKTVLAPLAPVDKAMHVRGLRRDMLKQ